jgi:hypothetical protein
VEVDAKLARVAQERALDCAVGAEEALDELASVVAGEACAPAVELRDRSRSLGGEDLDRLGSLSQ